jgi:hypothetical protein
MFFYFQDRENFILEEMIIGERRKETERSGKNKCGANEADK